MTDTTFSLNGREFPPDKDVANIFAFTAMMSAVVAQRRGGKASDYLAECNHFMADVVGKRLSVADPLPAEFDWRPSAAIECAKAMMEYDNG